MSLGFEKSFPGLFASLTKHGKTQVRHVFLKLCGFQLVFVALQKASTMGGALRNGIPQSSSHHRAPKRFSHR